MKRSKYLLLAVLFLLTQVGLPSAVADTKAADCIDLRNPTAVTSSTTFTLKFDVYSTCTAAQLGRANMQNPLYEMTQEESLFNLNSCSGPSTGPLIGSGWLGSASCNLRVGSNTLPSSRIGATSTVIRVWFAWDFSQKTITVNHPAIPATTNNGWGGSSGGGTSTSTVTPLATSCTAAPQPPTLTIKENAQSVLFSVVLNSSQPIYSVLWNRTFLNSLTGIWEPWPTSETVKPARNFSYEALSSKEHSRVAFSVTAINACGASSQVREIESNIGIALPQFVDLPNDALEAELDAANTAFDDAIKATQAASAALEAVKVLGVQVKTLLGLVHA